MGKREYWERRLGPGDHFRLRHVARLIGKSVRTVQRYADSGRLRVIGNDRTGDHRRVQREDLLEFLVHDYDAAVRR